MGLHIPYTYIPGITQQRGLTKGQTASLISLIGVFNMVGRIVSGAITDHPRVDALFMTFIALLSGAFCPLLMTWCFDYRSYAFACILYGVSVSVKPALTSSVLVDLLGLQLLTSAYGVLTCMMGAGALLGPPLAGYILDYMGPKTNLANSTLFVFLEDMDRPQLSDISTTLASDTDIDLGNYEVALYTSSLLLGISAVGHGLAFCVKKAQQNRRHSET